ncbi:sulfatase [Marinoscillum sp.]|uniref:sulfatase n=1 Tax=Marinoscillum sp. TaxID=2024838 RepID=UPI003BA87B30
MIIVDDLKPTLGTYGDTLAITPNIDQLALSGVQFDRAYCNFAVCGPSRSSFLTGLRPETLGILDNVTPLQSVLGDRITLPHLFKQNGFETIGIGKTFHDKDPSHEDPKAWNAYYKFQTTPLGSTGEQRNVTSGEFPWCYWQAAEGTNLDQQDGQVAQKAIDVIKTEREKPFFLAVGLHKPHDPFVAPRKYFDMYPIDDIQVPVLPKDWDRAFKHSLPGWHEVFDKMSLQDKKELKRAYYACTTFMDALVGQIIDALKESGQYDNTLIVFFGDHGYHLGEHGWWNKVTVYEEGVNAPFIMAGNSVKNKGIKSNAMFEFIDIYPTLAELMNLKNVPDYLEGESFASVVANPELSFKEAVYGVTMRGDMIGRMVKTDHWRYIEWDEGRSGRELYNQIDDPQEYENLAKSDSYYEEVMSRLSDSIREH